MSTTHKVTDYPSDTPRWDKFCAVAGIAFLIGVPVFLGCVIYVMGASAGEAMLTGASSVIIPIGFLMALGKRSWRLMIRSIGKPFECGERVEVVSGPLRGKHGTVKFPGQGGPLTLYVVLDDSADETIVFSWRHLRRTS